MCWGSEKEAIVVGEGSGRAFDKEDERAVKKGLLAAGSLLLGQGSVDAMVHLSLTTTTNTVVVAAAAAVTRFGLGDGTGLLLLARRHFRDGLAAYASPCLFLRGCGRGAASVGDAAPGPPCSSFVVGALAPSTNSHAAGPGCGVLVPFSATSIAAADTEAEARVF